MYAYGCSMGASVLGLYLVYANEEAGRQLDGAVLYGTPWNYFHGMKYFFESYWGIPAWFVQWSLRR